MFSLRGGGDNIPFQDTFNAFIMDIKPNEFYFVKLLMKTILKINININIFEQGVNSGRDARK